MAAGGGVCEGAAASGRAEDEVADVTMTSAGAYVGMGGAGGDGKAAIAAAGWRLVALGSAGGPLQRQLQRPGQ